MEEALEMAAVDAAAVGAVFDLDEKLASLTLDSEATQCRDSILLDTLRMLRLQHPTAGVKNMLRMLKEHSSFDIDTKTVRNLLQKVDAEGEATAAPEPRGESSTQTKPQAEPLQTDTPVCSICLDPLSKDPESAPRWEMLDYVELPGCKHAYHYSCFCEYQMSHDNEGDVRCPLCRSSIVTSRQVSRWSQHLPREWPRRYPHGSDGSR